MKFDCARIAAVAACVPQQRLALRTYVGERPAEEIERVIASTGIESVRVAPEGTTAADLCHAAAVHLLAEIGVDAATVDGLVFVSQTCDHILPATSVILQDRLGLRTDIVAFDLNYGCSGYVYGLLQAQMLISTGLCKSVLLCAGDTMTKVLGPRDMSVRMIFGDAGSATLVEKGSVETFFSAKTDGKGRHSLCIPAGGCRLPRSDATRVEVEAEEGNFRSQEHLYMDGLAIMNYALHAVPRIINEVLRDAGWNKRDVGLYALHQANRFVLNYLGGVCGFPDGSMPFAASWTGNTAPASIPLLLCIEHARLAEEQRLRRCVMCGFGVGFSTAAVATSLEGARLLPVLDMPGTEGPVAVAG